MYECLIPGMQAPLYASLSTADKLQRAGYDACCIFKTNLTWWTSYIIQGNMEKIIFVSLSRRKYDLCRQCYTPKQTF